jgi:hypothetical protein
MDLRPTSDHHGDTDPRAAERSAEGPLVAPDVPFTVGDLLNWTWAIYQARYSACLAVYWGAVALNWLILTTLNNTVREPASSLFLEFLFFLGRVIVPVWLLIGQNRGLLKIARQEPIALEELFRGGRYLLTTLLATLLVVAVASPPSLMVYWLAQNVLLEFPSHSLSLNLISLGGIGLGLALIFAVFVRLGQFSYVVFDRDAGVWNSLLGSWRMTRGQVATVFLIYLLYVTINFAGLLAFCVGLVFTLPLTSLLLVVTYDALSSGAAADVSSPPTTCQQEDGR